MRQHALVTKEEGLPSGISDCNISLVLSQEETGDEMKQMRYGSYGIEQHRQECLGSWSKPVRIRWHVLFAQPFLHFLIQLHNQTVAPQGRQAKRPRITRSIQGRGKATITLFLMQGGLGTMGRERAYQSPKQFSAHSLPCG